MLILMLVERHHLKSRLGDESVLGSEFGGSRRSVSRMSNASFDKMSQSRYSNYSGSQMSGRRPPRSGSRIMSPPGSVQVRLSTCTIDSLQLPIFTGQQGSFSAQRLPSLEQQTHPFQTGGPAL